MRLFAFVMLVASAAASAAPSSVCPPVLGERNMMLNTMSNVGTNKRWGELCRLGEARIKKMVSEGVAASRPCLNERGIKQVEIDQAMKSGAATADEIYARTGDKKAFCAKVDEEFDAL